MINLEGIDLLSKKEKELFFDLGMGFTYSELGVKHGVHKNTIAKKVSELRRKLSSVQKNNMFIIDDVVGEETKKYCFNMNMIAFAAKQFLNIDISAEDIDKENDVSIDMIGIAADSYSDLIFYIIGALASATKKKIVFTIDEDIVNSSDSKHHIINYKKFESFINEVSTHTTSVTELTIVTTSGNFSLRVKK